MIFKIGNSNLVKQIEIESGYSAAKSRFHDILTSKLGVSLAKHKPPLSATLSAQRSALPALSSSDLRLHSDITAESIDEALKGTALYGLGKDFISASRTYGVDARFLVALAAHESGYGSSKIARDKHNLFGFGAYDRSPYSSAVSFSSKAESIDRVAKYLSEEYLRPEGKHFNGYTVQDIGKKYASDPEWANKVIALMKKFR